MPDEVPKSNRLLARSRHVGPSRQHLLGLLPLEQPLDQSLAHVDFTVKPTIAKPPGASPVLEAPHCPDKKFSDKNFVSLNFCLVYCSLSALRLRVSASLGNFFRGLCQAVRLGALPILSSDQFSDESYGQQLRTQQ